LKEGRGGPRQIQKGSEKGMRVNSITLKTFKAKNQKAPEIGIKSKSRGTGLSLEDCKLYEVGKKTERKEKVTRRGGERTSE